MIRTNEEYKAAVDFIDKNLELYDFDLSEKMSSLEYNLYFQDVEYYLDILYEKMRTIEDLLEYLEYYSDVKIKQTQEKIKNKQKILENAVDIFTDTSAISYAPEWNKNNLLELKDRDGSDLEKAEISTDGIISFKENTAYSGFISGVSKVCDLTAYEDSLNDLSASGNYFAYYLLGKPRTIREKIIIETLRPEHINTLSYEPVNCNVEYLGQDSSNRFILQLICEKYSKGRQQFNFNNYVGSNLNTVKNTEFICANSGTIGANEDKNINAKEKARARDFLRQADAYQQTLAKQRAESKKIYASGL